MFNPPVTSSTKAEAELAGGALEPERHWFARTGVVGAIYHPGATIAASRQTIPGANATVSNNVSVTFDIGYDITKNLAASLMIGIPPKPTITGEGTIPTDGVFGKVR
jgi:outer membrane protein W